MQMRETRRAILTRLDQVTMNVVNMNEFTRANTVGVLTLAGGSTWSLSALCHIDYSPNFYHTIPDCRKSSQTWEMRQDIIEMNDEYTTTCDSAAGRCRITPAPTSSSSGVITHAPRRMIVA